jgi:hypothetical protein
MLIATESLSDHLCCCQVMVCTVRLHQAMHYLVERRCNALYHMPNLFFEPISADISAKLQKCHNPRQEFSIFISYVPYNMY